MKTTHLQYDTLSLQELSETLHLNYYDILSAMVTQAKVRLQELKMADMHQTTRQYTDICEKVLACIYQYLHECTQDLLPYLKELHEKDISGHNCSTCQGGCDIRHQSHLMHLEQSHMQLHKLLYELQSAALPLYSHHPFPSIYRNLRDEMLLIDTILRELFHIEEANMMPKILQSQKKINIHEH